MDARAFGHLFALDGRVAIVTGGTRGIGLAIAETLTLAGASVVVASRDEGACLAAQEHLAQLGGAAVGIPTHMGELDQVRQLVDRTVDEFGRLDIVVNNAATGLGRPIEELTPELWAKSFDVNLRGPVFLVRDAVPHLRASPAGAILNVISAGAFLFSAGTATYAAAKAALMSFTRSMAAEFAADGIRVNALAPGSVETDMVRKTPLEKQERMRRAALLQRVAQPDEMAAPALFLVSDAASFVTGQVLIADGGLTPR